MRLVVFLPIFYAFAGVFSFFLVDIIDIFITIGREKSNGVHLPVFEANMEKCGRTCVLRSRSPYRDLGDVSLDSVITFHFDASVPSITKQCYRHQETQIATTSQNSDSLEASPQRSDALS